MFKTGDTVEVFRPSQNDWICGKVMERRTREDGTAIFYVRIAGYVASTPDDPSVWFTQNQLRASKT